MVTLMKYRTKQGDVLDRICWNVYRHHGQEEAVLAANPGLVKYGPVLPADVVIVLPAVTTQQHSQTVRLWE